MQYTITLYWTVDYMGEVFPVRTIHERPNKRDAIAFARQCRSNWRLHDMGLRTISVAHPERGFIGRYQLR